MKLITKTVAASIAAVALTGCGANDYDPAITATPADIYQEGCQSCHGEKGEGKFGLLLTLAGTEASIEDISGKIKNGGHIMPSFPEIETPQRLMLSTYIKTF